MIECFSALADLIASYPELAEKSKFVFIPGNMDRGELLPRRELPNVILQKMIKKKFPGVIFATSPCRIKFCTMTLTLARENISSLLVQNAIIPPTLDSDLTKNVISFFFFF